MIRHESQNWSDFVRTNLPNVILSAPDFELSEATGLPADELEQARSVLTDTEFLSKVFACGRNEDEIASVLSGSEPWKFGYADEFNEEE